MDTIKQQVVLPEAELITRIITGERELFEILVRRNNPFLYKIGMSYGFSHHDTEDLMQDTFVAAFINLGKFEQRSSFRTWLTKIMLHLCYKKVNKPSFKNEQPADTSFTGKIIAMFTDNLNKDVQLPAEDRELRHIIESSLLSIPADYRIVFMLRELNGMSTVDTADALDISISNVKVRLYRARHMLRHMIEKVYSSEDIFEFNLIYCDKITARVMQEVDNISQA